MSKDSKVAEIDSSRYMTQTKETLTALIDQVRGNVARVDDPKAKALFETTAEVLMGLRRAYHDFGQKSEEVWKKAS
ncbi:MAG: hypothetical protein WBY75_00745 [Terracidiphilus sp.]